MSLQLLIWSYKESTYPTRMGAWLLPLYPLNASKYQRRYGMIVSVNDIGCIGIWLLLSVKMKVFDISFSKNHCKSYCYCDVLNHGSLETSFSSFIVFFFLKCSLIFVNKEYGMFDVMIIHSRWHLGYNWNFLHLE